MIDSLDLDWGSATDTGRIRDLNEDALLAHPPLFAVADGMGGHAAGEIASALALSSLRLLLDREAISGSDILGAIDHANSSIVGHARNSSETRGMGTTLSGICLTTLADVPHWFVFNVGDSRVYRYRSRKLEQLTTDHSEVEELVAAGEITADQARVHALRHVITRSLGIEPAPSVDLWTLPAVAGDTFLVCSDGLNTELLDSEIAHVLRLGWSAQMAADELCQQALVAGGSDNVSVVVVRPWSANSPEGEVPTSPRVEAATS